MPPTNDSNTATPRQRTPRKAPAKKAAPSRPTPAKSTGSGPTILTAVPDAPAGDRYAPTTWGVSLEDVIVPSGQLCQIRRVSLPDLVEQGILDKVDSLTQLVNEKVLSKKQKGRGAKAKSDAETMADLLKDPAKFREMMSTIYKVVQHIVVQPTLHRLPEPTEDNPNPQYQPGLVYVESVGQEDLMFLFNLAMGGSSSVERFRAELASNVGSVVDGAGMEDQAE